MKTLGADLPHSGCHKVQKVPGYIGLLKDQVTMKLGKETDKLYMSRSHTKARFAYLEIKKRTRPNWAK